MAADKGRLHDLPFSQLDDGGGHPLLLLKQEVEQRALLNVHSVDT